MKLFTFATSPYARKVRIVLDYKGIACETIERCYSLDRKEDLRSTSARAEVPVLVLDDGTVIAESIAICRYFEALQPDPPLFGRGALEVALVEMWNRRAVRSTTMCRNAIFGSRPTTPCSSTASWSRPRRW